MVFLWDQSNSSSENILILKGDTWVFMLGITFLNPDIKTQLLLFSHSTFLEEELGELGQYQKNLSCGLCVWVIS